MKRIKFILECITKTIKNKFFKSQKTDISHECEKLLENMEIVVQEGENKEEEYLLNYNITTRWQTL